MQHDVTGVRTVDIHAHFFPQAYLDVLAEDGTALQCRISRG